VRDGRLKPVVVGPDSFEGALEAIEFCFEKGWTDGLPVVPPTPERVHRMVEASGRDPQELLGLVPPRLGRATVEAVAVNAVMAGCRPEYMPVILAAVEAVLDERFNLNGVQATTHPCAPLIIVSGPVVKAINLNTGTNVFGHGFRANATIGRALRLVLLNLGGGIPEIGDKSVHGHPGKYTFCIGESLESPWELLHVERGFPPDESAVTVIAVEAPHSILGGLAALVDHLAALGSNTMGLGGEALIVLSPPVAERLAKAGWTKQDVRSFIFEHARAPLGKIMLTGVNKELFGISVIEELPGVVNHWPRWLDLSDPDTRVPVVWRPEDLLIVVAGGRAIGFCSVLPGWGYMGGFSVTRPIRMP